MARSVRPESTRRLCELALAPGPVAAAGVVPRHGDVYEPLQEVALRGRRIAPLVLELLVRLEVGAGANQIEASLEPHGGIIGVRERC